MFERLRSSPPPPPLEPLPGWLARRSRSAPPSADLVKRLPSGPVLQRAAPSAGAGGWHALPQESRA
ncbi:hypothetical protein D3C83_88770 [compost metagenome]